MNLINLHDCLLIIHKNVYVSADTTEEYPENSSIFVNCTEILSYTRIMDWEICINGSLKNICTRYGDEDESRCRAEPLFVNRVRKVDDATMEVINMRKEESGVTGCFIGSLDRRIYENNVLFIGNTILNFILTDDGSLVKGLLKLPAKSVQENLMISVLQNDTGKLNY